MLRNFLTVALRNFLRQRLYSFINVVGLASGLVCTLFIFFWVNDEVRKDKFHHESEKVYRVVSNLEFNKGELLTWAITPGPLADVIRTNIPEVEIAVRTQDSGPALVSAEGKEGFMESGYFADPGFFDLFSFEIVEGKPTTDTADVSSIAISTNLADKLFAGQPAVGQTVRFNNQRDLTVAAVFREPGAESSLHFNYILPFEIYKRNRGDGFNWDNFDHPLYLKLRDPAQAGAAMAKINEHMTSLREGSTTGLEFYLQPFTDAYLYGQFKDGRPVGGQIQYVRIFSMVAVFILVIACINFMNMATARAAMRAKEVGIRKVIGAQRRLLIFQFIGESTLISLIAMMIALVGVYLLLPLFNAIVSKHVAIDLSDPFFLVVVAGIVVVTGVAAGSYPAFFLSSYQPAQVLKGSSHTLLSGTFLRKTLVAFQFTLTIVLIASTLVVYRQISFIMNTDVGYNRESVLTFEVRGNLWNNFDVFRNELLASPAIHNVSRANNSVVQVQNQNSSLIWPGKPDGSTVFFRTIVSDFEFPETLGLQLKEGRFFSREFNDTSTFLISERAVEVMGLQDPVGTPLDQWGIKGTVVGVVKDFHGRSLHESLDPFVILQKADWAWRVFVRFEATRTQEALAHVESVYRKFVPQFPLSYTFLDEDFARLYTHEQIGASLALGFTLMAIIISALGLVGLAAYTAERRRKEIGIRKTLGAPVVRIVTMISADFAKLSLIAILIGCPVAYWLMESLVLSRYAYRTDFSWVLFLTTAGLAFLISLLTVIFQVVRAAMANPVDALRSE